MFADLTEQLLGLVEDGEIYLVLLPVYVVLLGGERVAHFFVEKKRRWDERDAATNVAITVLFLGVEVFVGAILPVALLVWLYENVRIATFGFGPWGWLLAFVAYDLAWYIDHRIAHRTGFFWAFHHVHHSSNEYNMTVASRGFVLDNTLITRPFFFILPVLGMSPLHLLVVKLVTNIYGIAQHTRLVPKLPVLDAVLATPSNHRVHHGSDEKYLDRNYGEVLILWDRLFGTYQREEEEPTYGVVDRLESYNIVTIETAGIRWFARKVRSMPTVADKLRCFVYPPGWYPEGLRPPGYDGAASGAVAPAE